MNCAQFHHLFLFIVRHYSESIVFLLLHFLCSEVSSYYIDLFSKDFFCFLSFIFLFWHILNLNEDIRRLSKVQQLEMRLIFVFFERKHSNICWSLTSTETFLVKVRAAFVSWCMYTYIHIEYAYTATAVAHERVLPSAFRFYLTFQDCFCFLVATIYEKFGIFHSAIKITIGIFMI